MLSEDMDSFDPIVNSVNGAEIDCVLATIASPLQEVFIAQNHALLNARIWLGCGKGLRAKYKQNIRESRIRSFLIKRIFKHQVEQSKH